MEIDDDFLNEILREQKARLLETKPECPADAFRYFLANVIACTNAALQVMAKTSDRTAAIATAALLQQLEMHARSVCNHVSFIEGLEGENTEH